MSQSIALSQIVEIENYRSEYPTDHIAGLADSMRARGFDPAYPVKLIVVAADRLTRQPLYGLVAGHCRTRAARLAGLSTVVGIVLDTLDPAALMLDQLGENENRRDPNPLDQAVGYRRALGAGTTMESLCAAIGKRADVINRRLALLKLIPEAQALFAHGQMPIGCAEYMVDLDRNFQLIALKDYNESKMNAADFKKRCLDLYTKQSQCTLMDLSLFNGKPIEQVMSALNIERQKSRADLERELEAERKARTADREFAKRKYTELLASYRNVLSQLEKTA